MMDKNSYDDILFFLQRISYLQSASYTLWPLVCTTSRMPPMRTHSCIQRFRDSFMYASLAMHLQCEVSARLACSFVPAKESHPCVTSGVQRTFRIEPI